MIDLFLMGIGVSPRSRIYENSADEAELNLHFLHKSVACLFLDILQSARSDDGQGYMPDNVKEKCDRSRDRKVN